MTGNIGVILVIHGPCLKNRLGVTEDFFNLPELFVLERHLGSRQHRVGAQHPLSFKPAFSLQFVAVDADAFLADEKMLPETLVSDQPLGVVFEPVFAWI